MRFQVAIVDRDMRPMIQFLWEIYDSREEARESLREFLRDHYDLETELVSSFAPGSVNVELVTAQGDSDEREFLVIPIP